MIGAAADVPGLYSLVFVVPLYVDWCCRPKLCPASCEIASAVYFGLPPPRFPENANTVVWFANPPYGDPGNPNVNPLTYDTPPAADPSHPLVPPITARTACPALYDPGSSVVTSMLNGEYFSDTRDQISRMFANSVLLNVVGSP